MEGREVIVVRGVVRNDADNDGQQDGNWPAASPGEGHDAAAEECPAEGVGPTAFLDGQREHDRKDADGRGEEGVVAEAVRRGEGIAADGGEDALAEPRAFRRGRRGGGLWLHGSILR